MEDLRKLLSDYDNYEILQYLRNERYLAIDDWDVGDIIHRAKQLGKTISKEAAKKLLKEVDYNVDANFGINWDIIDSYIKEYEKL